MHKRERADNVDGRCPISETRADRMNNRRNYYRILQVQPDAPAEVIRSSYRTLMQRLKMHPDLGGDHTRAALINEAYSTLADPGRRSAYDSIMNNIRERQRSQFRPPLLAPQSMQSPSACVFCGAR